MDLLFSEVIKLDLIGSKEVECNSKGSKEGHEDKQEPLDVEKHLDDDVDQWGDFIHKLHEVEILRKE